MATPTLSHAVVLNRVGNDDSPNDPSVFTLGEIATILADSTAVSAITSQVTSTAASGALDSAPVSTADSKAVSSASRASVADSKALSVSGNVSVADSKALSVSVNVSVADSKAVSLAGATTVLSAQAHSENVSRADSKGVSAATKVDAAVPEDTGTVTTLSDYLANNVVLNVKNFGAVGDGVTDDTEALADWATALSASGGDAYIPDGIYKNDGSVTVAPERDVDDVRIRFGPNAWLAPTAGWGLKLDGAFRTILEKPKIRLITGTTATRGIWVVDSRWPEIEKPIIWAYAEIPSGFVGIDVDDNSYWCEIKHPAIRKFESGSSVANFATGVRFRDVSNAGTVWGGSINHCDNGGYIDGLNACRFIGTAFENCVDGVEVAEGTTGPNGHTVAFCRFEDVTNDVNISASTIIPNGWPVQIFGTVYTSNDTILNPNSLPFHTRSHGGVRVAASDAAFELRDGGGPRLRDSGGSGFVEANGNVTLNADLDGNGAGEVRLATGVAAATRRFTANPTGIGFYTTAPVAKQTITGVRDSNAALANLLTALAALGLVTDSTTAT